MPTSRGGNWLTHTPELLPQWGRSCWAGILTLFPQMQQKV
nr:MAG TPA: hypothetical protein [Caudoviricetes sp.]